MGLLKLSFPPPPCVLKVMDPVYDIILPYVDGLVR